MPDDQPINRRRFFREGLRGLFENIGKATGPLQRAMKELENAKQGFQFAEVDVPAPPSYAPPPGRALPIADDVPAERILRPPGARDEDDFVRTCSTCGHCVAACPVHAIQLSPGRAGGAPFIIAEEQACTLCDGLNCMYSCPSGAIIPEPIGLIDMGTAQWRPEQCIRTTEGSDCTICIERCPIGPRAIELLEGNIAVHQEGCTGCGVCEQHCPTSPKSIVVTPKALR